MKEETLIEIIKTTINGEEHLGVNLKEQCIEYIENLQQENERLKKENTEYQDEIFVRDNNWYDMQD